MAPLSAFFLCSLDLRLTDEGGDFGWAEPPIDVHAFANERDRPVGARLYGRRMWQTMRFWESMPDEDSVMGDYGRLWRGSDKIVYSRTLDRVDTARTLLRPEFDPDEIRSLKAAATAPLTVSGAELAGHAFAAGLVDELELLLVPALIGSGPRVLPEGVRVDLDLREQRTFPTGWVHLRYTVAARA